MQIETLSDVLGSDESRNVSDDDAPNESGLWLAYHDYDKVGIYVPARHQRLVGLGCIMSIHSTAADARRALRPEASQASVEAEVAMEVDTEAVVESRPPGALQSRIAIQPLVAAQSPVVAVQPPVAAQPPAVAVQPPVAAQPPAAAQPPVAVNQVLTPAVEALLAELALQLPETEAVTAEVERELTQFAADVANSATSAARNTLT